MGTTQDKSMKMSNYYEEYESRMASIENILVKYQKRMSRIRKGIDRGHTFGEVLQETERTLFSLKLAIETINGSKHESEKLREWIVELGRFVQDDLAQIDSIIRFRSDREKKVADECDVLRWRISGLETKQQSREDVICELMGRLEEKEKESSHLRSALKRLLVEGKDRELLIQKQALMLEEMNQTLSRYERQIDMGKVGSPPKSTSRSVQPEAAADAGAGPWDTSLGQAFPQGTAAPTDPSQAFGSVSQAQPVLSSRPSAVSSSPLRPKDDYSYAAPTSNPRDRNQLDGIPGSARDRSAANAVTRSDSTLPGNPQRSRVDSTFSDSFNLETLRVDPAVANNGLRPKTFAPELPSRKPQSNRRTSLDDEIELVLRQHPPTRTRSLSSDSCTSSHLAELLRPISPKKRHGDSRSRRQSCERSSADKHVTPKLVDPLGPSLDEAWRNTLRKYD
ncbi:uncharacterized protein BJ171DRAFT_473208 [Polychytrium aggregatum]|uniref:uncharacterized protein n=1 Tax=Polychytrium aggregatum TaxID=110093 RepID=UPI0022FE9FC3|nr:uncharacterized protein BJ171DRAFT_473208 [Polychytrium aggregatum]KAI9206700.1 hypothetical protein BJ171DRAFT_473208 [Polychytrium aggregatum]